MTCGDRDRQRTTYDHWLKPESLNTETMGPVTFQAASSLTGVDADGRDPLTDGLMSVTAHNGMTHPAYPPPRWDWRRSSPNAVED